MRWGLMSLMKDGGDQINQRAIIKDEPEEMKDELEMKDFITF